MTQKKVKDHAISNIRQLKPIKVLTSLKKTNNLGLLKNLQTP